MDFFERVTYYSIVNETILPDLNRVYFICFETRRGLYRYHDNGHLCYYYYLLSAISDESRKDSTYLYYILNYSLIFYLYLLMKDNGVNDVKKHTYIHTYYENYIILSYSFSTMYLYVGIQMS